MLKVALLLVCISAMASAKFHSCKHIVFRSLIFVISPINNLGKEGKYPTQITLTGCDVNRDRCPIRIGTKLSFEMEFVATSDANSVTPHVSATWDWFTYTLAIDQDDMIGCNSITTLGGAPGCPLVAGQTYKYNVNLDVNRLPPSGFNISVEIYLEGDQGRQTCFSLDAEF